VHERDRLSPLKTIVCFGDSNTWGYMPGSDGGRFPREVRWPARLATALAGEAEVIAEGLNGRTASIESPVAEGRNGLPYLVPCLRSHAPVDLLIIYLGTNDAYWLEPIMVAGSIGRLVKVARASEAGTGGAAPDLLVVCPPPFGGHELAPAFREVCDRLGCELLDLDGVATYSDLDDTHLEETGQIAVAAAVERCIRKMLVCPAEPPGRAASTPKPA
jgi:lysophospholipase L1-like esterase